MKNYQTKLTSNSPQAHRTRALNCKNATPGTAKTNLNSNLSLPATPKCERTHETASIRLIPNKLLPRKGTHRDSKAVISGSQLTATGVKVAQCPHGAGVVCLAPGEFQINVKVPASWADGDHPITATINGATTQAGVLITVRK